MTNFSESDFDERIRRAALDLEQKGQVEQDAKRALREQYRDFLVGFQLATRNIIEPILKRAKKQIENSAAASLVKATVLWSSGEDGISLVLLTPKGSYDCVSFRADYRSVIVYVGRSTSNSKVSSLQEAAFSASLQEPGKLKLSEIEGQEQRIADLVADFVAWSFNGH